MFCDVVFKAREVSCHHTMKRHLHDFLLMRAHWEHAEEYKILESLEMVVRTTHGRES